MLFDPYHLTPPASMNRVKIVDVPGVVCDPDVRGRNAHELVSAARLTGLIQARAQQLGIDPMDTPETLHRALDAILEDALLSGVQTCAHAAAREIVWEIGRSLGYILLVLCRGDSVNQDARSEWDETYWAHWAGIRQVWLGGGLMQGMVGQYLLYYAQSVLNENGMASLMLRRSQYGPALSLVGAARYAPPSHAGALVFDLGGTQIKHAWTTYEDGKLTGMNWLPTVPTANLRPDSIIDDPEYVILDRVIDLIASSRRAAYAGSRIYESSPVAVLCSMATYLRDGHPLPAEDGLYMRLGAIVPNLQETIAQRLTAAWREPVGVTLLHDGTAAASAYAGAVNAAVITLGTALGIGFPPPAADLRPIEAGFKIQA